MSTLLGVSGARRNACAAVCVNGEIRAACEQERVTRIRRVGMAPHRLPVEAIEQVLALAGRRRHDVSSYVLAEQQVRVPAVVRSISVDHHEAHAATAFLTSPLARAAVIVCDRSPGREVSVWVGEDGRVREHAWPRRGRGFATLYSECATLFSDPETPNPESRLEALAHLGRPAEVARDGVHPLFQYRDGAIETAPGWRSTVSELIRQECHAGRPDAVQVASALQHRIGELLLEFAADVRRAAGIDALCLAGGLFYNTYFTTLLQGSGIFADVFVPINPGNAGLAIGATLMLSQRTPSSRAGTAVTPFLGPEFDDEAIKETLDGCKLSYSFDTESGTLDATVDALVRGELVGWFQGRMEWGHRALGHRSILADPRSPYVLDNLNGYLRKRERWRAFGVSACADAVPALFSGPPSSPFMEYEYEPRHDLFRHVLPAGARSLRVQTVAQDAGPFWALHKRMEQATGAGVLVNTSLNGFHEPIACTPRDAIRVFYGTGLDMLVMGRFILRK